MAQTKIDDREVKKIKAAIAQEGEVKAARRFGNSPEMQKVQQSRKNGQSRAIDRHRAERHAAVQDTATSPTKTQSKGHEMKPQARSTQQKTAASTQQRTAAQKKIAQRQQAQAQQNAQVKSRSQSQSQAMGV